MATNTFTSPPNRSSLQPCVDTSQLAAQISAARNAQPCWARVALRNRLAVLRNVRHEIVDRADDLVSAVTYPHRNGPAETLASEVIPLADAGKFLEKRAGKILAPRRLSRRNRPLWLHGVSVEIRREPFGVVLIVGAANYPVFLTGVQALQALAAGNAVLIKPGNGAGKAARAVMETFVAGGLDEALIQILPEEPDWVDAAVKAGVDKVVLTGSADTGRRVQSLLADTLTPATMELSGCDAVFVLDSADLDRVARCLEFGLRFNGSATCIAPRRVFITRRNLEAFEQRLCEVLSPALHAAPLSCLDRVADLVQDAILNGARAIVGGVDTTADTATLVRPTVLSDASSEMELLRSDVFAPVVSLVPVDSIEDALSANRRCPFALGASIFGDRTAAQLLASQVDAGCVVINDVISPTADPRVPFGGRKQSGFGVTRGAAGLEEMTQIKTVIHQRSRWLPHLNEPTPLDASLLAGFLGLTHGRSWRQRIGAAVATLRAGMAQHECKREQKATRRLDSGK